MGVIQKKKDRTIQYNGFIQEAKKIYDTIQADQMFDMDGIELKKTDLLTNEVYVAKREGDKLITVKIKIDQKV